MMWARPEPGDIVWCHFPQRPRDVPGPKPRPALILTVSELAILTGIWHGTDSVLQEHSTGLLSGGVVVLAVGVWQMVITRRIDYYVVHPPAEHHG